MFGNLKLGGNSSCYEDLSWVPALQMALGEVITCFCPGRMDRRNRPMAQSPAVSTVPVGGSSFWFSASLQPAMQLLSGSPSSVEEQAADLYSACVSCLLPLPFPSLPGPCALPSLVSCEALLQPSTHPPATPLRAACCLCLLSLRFGDRGLYIVSIYRISNCLALPLSHLARTECDQATIDHLVSMPACPCHPPRAVLVGGFPLYVQHTFLRLLRPLDTLPRCFFS